MPRTKQTRMDMRTQLLQSLLAVALVAQASAQSASPTKALADGGFEGCTANGTAPDSGAWKPAWLNDAGAIVTTTARRTGRSGLWAYTGRAPQDTWAAVRQDLPAVPGNVFHATGHVRTPVNEPWVKGSKAQLCVEFMDSEGKTLARLSSEPLASPATEWQRHSVMTCPAPAGTARVRFSCYVEKPAEAGISVANFDDCSCQLEEQTPQP